MEKENIFEKNIIQERIKYWAEKLIDLSGTNDLISYRDAKTNRRRPSNEGRMDLVHILYPSSLINP